jgi:predicted nuclease of predicted toxin-antitoxin system
MRVLLDVCTPVQVRDALPGHEVHTAARMGWKELENGDLLRAAEDS